MPIYRDGTINVLGLTNPGVYVDIIPPTPAIVGVPSNIEGLVGVASWGPVGSPVNFSSPDDCANKFGTPLVRTYDMPTFAWAGFQAGRYVNYVGIRVTDGTDTAASATVQTNGGTATAIYTGAYGNGIQISFLNGTAIGTYAAVIYAPNRAPERFNNIGFGLTSITTTAGSGYTSVPTVTAAAPTAVGGKTAQVAATLKVVSATLGTGGSGHAVNDVITFSNGVQITVNTISSGAVATFTVTNGGTLAAGSVPSNPVAMVSTTGTGTGATFSLVWGLGTPKIVSRGTGYTSGSLTLTLTNGGAGSGGSYAGSASFWGAFQDAVNNGTIERGPSRLITFSAGTSTAVPLVGSTGLTTLSGGTDGAAGVGTSQMLGSDVAPRKGMYALRKTGVDCFALCDVTDTSSWATQVAFGQDETAIAVLVTVSGDTIANAVATRQSIGIDDYGAWILVGDWPTFYDTQNGLSRLVSPQAFALGLVGNLAPHYSPINHPVGGVAATQTTMSNRLLSDADIAIAETGGVDIISAPSPGGNFFSFYTGRNSSSNTIARAIEWTRLTYWLAKSINSTAAGSVIGQLQSIRPDDPLRQKAKAILDSFFANVQSQGMIDQFAVTCDLSNNPPALQALGYLFAYCQVRYLNTVRYFIVKLAGAGNVTVISQATAPSPAQFTS